MRWMDGAQAAVGRREGRASFQVGAQQHSAHGERACECKGHGERATWVLIRNERDMRAVKMTRCRCPAGEAEKAQRLLPVGILQ